MLIVNGNASDYLEFTMIKMIIKMNDDRLRQRWQDWRVHSCAAESRQWV